MHESETKVADLLAGKVAILKDEGTEAGKPVLNIEMIKQNLLSIFELLGGLMNLDFDEEIKNLVNCIPLTLIFIHSFSFIRFLLTPYLLNRYSHLFFQRYLLLNAR